MSTGTTCTLYLAGNRFADGAPSDLGSDPFALSGLEVAWGRDTTVDQPDPSTCSFTVADPAGGRSFLGQLHTGVPIDVTATGTEYPDPTVSTFADPGFETDPIAATPQNATVGASHHRAHGGARALQVVPVDGTRRWTVTLPPAPYVPAGTNPGAWDGIPTTAPGQTWDVGTWVYAPPGVTLSVSPALFAGPWSSPITWSAGTETTVTGTGAWMHVRAPFLPDVAGQWVGLVISAYPTGPAWADIPHGTSTGNVELLLPTVAPGGTTYAGPIEVGSTITAAVDCVATGLRQPIKSRTMDGRQIVATVWDNTTHAVLAQDRRVQTAADALNTFVVIPFDAPVTLSAGRVVVASNYLPVGTDGKSFYPAPPGTAAAGQVTSIAAGSRFRTAQPGPSFPTSTSAAGAGIDLVVAPVTAYGTWATATGTWQDVAAVYVDDVTVLAPAAGTEHTVLVFSGRITNLTAAWDDGIGGAAVDVTAADFTADLDNRDIGDEPWAVEAMGDRFNRILALAGMPVTADIDPSVYGIPISWRDVDNQAATGLLQDLATSVDAVMWSAVHQTTGAYLRVEDPAGRVALYRLELVDGVVQVVDISGGTGTVLSACDVLRDPIQFVQDVSDITTRAGVTWLEQTVDDDGQPGTTEHTVTVIDADLETLYGTRRVGVSTELQAQADAVDVANRLMARLTASGWRASGFTIDDDDLDQAADLLLLLDGTSRIGLPARVTDLPPWSPAGPVLPVYVEGGKYRYDDGRWVLDLNVSSARGQGQSVTWAELDPTWAWDQVDPELSWAGVYGVAGPDLEAAA